MLLPSKPTVPVAAGKPSPLRRMPLHLQAPLPRTTCHTSLLPCRAAPARSPAGSPYDLIAAVRFRSQQSRSQQAARDLESMMSLGERPHACNDSGGEDLQDASTSQPTHLRKDGTPRKQRRITAEENEQGLRWLARCLMGVYVGFGQTEEEAYQELKRLRVGCYSVHVSTRRFFLEDSHIKGSFSRPQLIEALNLQFNSGCSGSTVRKQFTQTMAKMSPEEAEKGMHWLAQGLTGAFVGMGQTEEETMEILKKRGVACTCIGERGTKRYFSIMGMPGRFVGRPAVVHALNLQVLDRAKAAKTVGGSVASTFDVNDSENDGALGWLAGHILAGTDKLGETLEQVVAELKRRNVRCVRIEKRASNPRRFFKVGDDPDTYPGLMSTLAALGLMG